MTANRTKTIEYAFSSSTASTTITNDMNTTPTIFFGLLPITIPETTDRAFTSVAAYYGCRDNSDAANNNGFNQCRFSIGITGNIMTDYNFLDDIPETDENISILQSVNLTNWFQTNFTESSHVISSQCQFMNATAVNIPISNVWGKLVITYEYNDENQETRIKTVRLPIGSTLTPSISGSFVILGENQIPALDTYLPEASKSYKDIFFEGWINEGANSVLDNKLIFNASSLSSIMYYSSNTFERALNSDCADCFIWKMKETIDPSQKYSLRSKVFGSLAAFDNVGGILNVTYTYNHTDSTSILNSVVIPFNTSENYTKGIIAGNKEYNEVDVYIEEPDPITLKQSGIWYALNSNAATTFHASSNGQMDYPYTLTLGGATAGFSSIYHRIDVSGNLSLSRGKNIIKSSSWITSLGIAGPTNTTLYLNYLSGKDPGGDGKHNHTIYTMMPSGMMDDGWYVSSLVGKPAPEVNETYYFINGVGYIFNSMLRTANYGFGLEGKNLGSENYGFGFVDYGNRMSSSDAETGPLIANISCINKFKRYWNYPYNYQDIRNVRDVRINSTANTVYTDVVSILTYHSISSNIVGTVSGYSGDGSNIVVQAYSASGNYLGSSLTAVGGDYMIPWYDNVHQVYTTAYEDATHCGRSKNGTT